MQKVLDAHKALGLTGPFWWSLDAGSAILFSADRGQQVVATSSCLSFRENEKGYALLTNAVEAGADNPAAIALASAWMVPLLVKEVEKLKLQVAICRDAVAAETKKGQWNV